MQFSPARRYENSLKARKNIYRQLLAQDLHFLKHTLGISGHQVDIFGLKEDLKNF